MVANIVQTPLSRVFKPGYRGYGDKKHIDAARAEELYRKALGMDPEEDKVIQERLRD